MLLSRVEWGSEFTSHAKVPNSGYQVTKAVRTVVVHGSLVANKLLHFLPSDLPRSLTPYGPYARNILGYVTAVGIIMGDYSKLWRLAES